MIEVVSGTSGANAALVATLTGVTDWRHKIYSVVWSYSADPTGGSLTSTGLRGTGELFYNITVGGPGAVPMPPVYADLGSDVTFTLAAAGGAIVGTLSIFFESE